MIRKLDGIVWAYVTINRPKPRGGYRPVPNPSKLFLAERQSNAPGSAVLCLGG